MEMPRDRLRAALLARCRQEKVEPPAPARTERLLVAAEAMFERQFTQATAGRLSTESIGKLEELIVPGAPAAPADAEGREAGEDGTGPEPGPGEEARAGSAGGGRAFLQELKEDPGPLTLETLLAEIGKLERVKALKLPDGLFEGVSEKIVAGWHQRYGGPGIMVYWHVERKSVCIYSQVTSTTASEVASMIEGLLRHLTSAEIDRHYTDTHGASIVGFAFAHLLDFQLLPRLKNIGTARLYRPGAGEDEAWPRLDSVLSGKAITGERHLFEACTIPCVSGFAG
jgi:Tn3 transposase DDE domain